MSYKQLITPILNTAGNIGYCLAFVESAYATPHLYPYAFTAWQSAVNKHGDQNFPEGMYVPIYFNYMVGNINEGHIAIRQPNGTILSSPWQSGTTQAILPSIAELIRIYSDNGKNPLTYLGWSEDLAGVQLVESVSDASVQLCAYTPQSPVKQMLTSAQPTNWWNLNNDTSDINNFQPAAQLNQNTIFTIGGYAVNYHFPQYTYAMTPEDYARAISGDFSTNNGVNIADLHEIPPVITPPAPVVVVPPPTLPAAPVVVAQAQKYTLITPLSTYASDINAISRTNRLALTLSSGEYYVWNTTRNAYQLSMDNMIKPTNNWVNILDNVKPTPVVTPTPVQVKTLPSQVPIGTDTDNKWKATYKSFHPDRTSDVYETKQQITMKEYSGKRKPLIIPAKYRINVIGTFVKNGVTFYRPRDRQDATFAWYFGIPMYDDDGDLNLVKVVEPIIEEAEQSLKDIVYYLKDDLRKWWDIKVLKKKAK